MTRFGDNPVASTVSIPPRRQPGHGTSTRNRRDFKLNVSDPDLLIPSNDTKQFQINNKGHLQCLQDPKLIHKPNDKGKLPGSREAPIYHEPGTVSCKTVEDLKKLYPN